MLWGQLAVRSDELYRKGPQNFQAPGIALAPCHGALRPHSAPFRTRGRSRDGGSFRPLRAGQGCQGCQGQDDEAKSFPGIMN